VTDTVRVKIDVHGRVQGVGYRAFVLDHTDGLRGTVANTFDGAVECVLEGPRERIEQVVAELRKGPAMAEVDRVEVTELVADSPLPEVVEGVG
jgi:acylphosphatase